MLIQMLENKDVIQDSSFLCNQYDNESASIAVNLPALFTNADYNYYIICKAPNGAINQYSVPLVLSVDKLTFAVTSVISCIIGNWQFCIVIKSATGNLIAISAYWTGKVLSGIATQDELVQQAEDANLKLLYDASLEAETLRVIAEDDRLLSETDRKISEATRVSNENTRLSAETERISAENLRIPAEETRIINEDARKSAETIRLSNEVTRVNSEDLRVNAESTRGTAENARIANEENRITAESVRLVKETERLNAETDRLSSETTRKSNETTRVSNESGRVTAESGRVTAESNRGTAETGRVNAESTRVTAESERVTAETARANAESTRATFYDGFSSGLADITTQLSVGKVKKYGVKFTGSNPIGARLYDAVGMVANVAVDNAVVQNDFDNVSFFNRPMCNVYFDAVGKPQVMAYRGEPGFNFQGAIFPPYIDKADVYYECSPCAWNGSYDEPVITGTPAEGFELFPCFPDWNTKIYLPSYWMAVVDNKPTSRSGVLPGYYSLNTAMSTAKTWNTNAHTETMAARMYEYVLQLVEFATMDVQNVMMGAANLSYNSSTDTATVAEAGVNRIILANATADKYVVGQTIVIGTTANATNVATERSITSIEVYDANNKAVNFDGASANIAIGNFVSSRVWKNGATDIIVASSGSPVSNISGKYPCIWRGKVDPWANGFSVICDILIKRNGAGTVGSPYTYRPYFLPDPRKYANGVITNDYIELQYDIPQSDGYAKLLWQDSRYKFIGLTKEIGAASTTYLAAYYYYPRYNVCVVFVGGNFLNGRACSPVYFDCSYAPSYSIVYRLARLFVSRV